MGGLPPRKINTIITSGRKVTTTPGTAVAVGTGDKLSSVTIQALLTNTDMVVVGGSNVVATPGSENGVQLTAGMSMTIPCTDLSKIYFDAVVSGEGVIFIYTNV